MKFLTIIFAVLLIYLPKFCESSHKLKPAIFLLPVKAVSSMRLVRLEPQGPARYNEKLQKYITTLGPEISREKICGFLKFLPSGISIRAAVLPQFTPRLTNQLKQNNKQSLVAQEKAHLTVFQRRCAPALKI